MEGNDGQGRGKRLGPAKWLAIRTAFVIDGMSYKDCEKKWNVAARTIRGRAKREGWSDERQRRISQAQDTLVDKLQDEVDAEIQTQDETAGELEGALRYVVQAYKDAVTKLSEATTDAERKIAKTTVGEIRGAIEAGRSLAEMADKVLRTRRLVRGLQEGEPSDTGDETERELVIRQQRLEPKPIKVDAKGQAVNQ